MKTVTLREITLNITDGKHGDCEPAENSGYYFVSCKDVNNGTIDYANARQISERAFLETHKRTQLEPNDILITNSGTIGRMALVKDIPETYRTTFQKSVAIVKPDISVVLPTYLYYKLQNRVTDFVNCSNGSAQKNLLLGTMRKFQIDLHEDFAEQERLSSILAAYDNLIENNQKQIKLLEEAAQRLYKEWFVDFRFPRYEDTPIVDGVPEGWSLRPISDFGEVVTGKTPSTEKKEYYGGNIPFVKIPDMHGCVYPVITESSLTEAGAKTQINKFIPRNGIMVSCIATVGLVNIAVERCQTNQQINSIILSDERDLYYVFSAVKRLKELLEGVGSNGATMTNVNKMKFASLPVLYPSEELRDSYYSFCKPIFEKIYNLSLSVVRLKKSRDRLLPKLMSGEIEV